MLTKGRKGTGRPKCTDALHYERGSDGEEKGFKGASMWKEAQERVCETMRWQNHC